MDRLEALLASIADGDRPAFRKLYDAAGPKLYGIVVRICRDHGIAQDVLQDAFLKIWTKAASYDANQARPITWLVSIARNTAIDAIRRSREIPLGMDDEGRSVIDSFGQATSGADPAELLALRRCLDGLERSQQECLLLAYCAGHSREELATRFSAPVGTIKTWLHRGLARLRACLDPAL